MTRKKQGPRILTADIETLPLTVYNWSLFDEPRALDRLVQDWAVFSIAAKWLGDKRVLHKDTRLCKDAYDDKELLIWARELLDEADIVVGQNVLRFDMRKLRARMIKHGLKPFREPAIIDTMLIAKDVARFTSNKLEYTSTLTGVQKSKHLKYPGFALWLGIMNNERAAWAEAKQYNIIDVVSTEQLYLTLRPWARHLPNLSHYYSDEKTRCPRCGSEDLTEGEHIHRGVSEYRTFECNGCGGFSRSRYTLNSRLKREGLLCCV